MTATTHSKRMSMDSQLRSMGMGGNLKPAKKVKKKKSSRAPAITRDPTLKTGGLEITASVLRKLRG
jgi:hypothetical protein